MTDKDLLQLLGHDAFRYGGGLNKSAAEVYWFLLQESMTATELSRRTGRSRRTVFRSLARMSNLIDMVTGEVISMVEKDGDKWKALNVDLEHIAQVVGTAGIAVRQQKRHTDERRAHRRALLAGRKLNGGSEKV